MSYKEDALTFLGITRWHELGYTGKGDKDKLEQQSLFFFYTKK